VSPGRVGGGAGGYGEQEQQEEGRRGHENGKGRALLADSSSSGPHRRPLLLALASGAQRSMLVRRGYLQASVSCRTDKRVRAPGQRKDHVS
jgi:hypothetical protein